MISSNKTFVRISCFPNADYILQTSLIHHPNNYMRTEQKNVVEWLTLLLRIREVPGSNQGPETGVPV
jgi:hypothetical protein